MNAAVEHGGRRRSAPAAVIALAAALAICLLAVAWLLLDRAGTTADLERTREEQSATEDGLAAARNFLTAATSYSWREGEHEFTWLDQLADDEVRSGIEGSLGDLRASIVDQRLTARGQVVDAAARGVDDAHVEVLAFVDQEISRAGDERTTVDQMRIVVTMRRTGGAWLVDDLVFQSGGLGATEREGALD